MVEGLETRIKLNLEEKPSSQHRADSSADYSGRWTLRFRNRVEEEGYVRYNFKSLVYSFRLCGIIALCISIWFFLSVCLSTETLEPRWQILQMWGCFVILAISVVACTSSGSILKIHPAVFEFIVVVFCSCLIPCVYVMIPVFFCAIFGFDWRVLAVEPFCPDTLLLLGLDTVVTAVHVVLPVRWCVLWPFEALAVASYIFRLLVLPLSNPLPWFNELPLFTFVVFMGGYGKRANERAERKNFKILIQERTLRVEAENSLAMWRSSDKPKPDQSGSENDSDPSLPTTTPTGRMFAPDHDVLESRESAQEQLHQIFQLGIQEHWLIQSEDVQVRCDDILGVGSYGLVAAGSYYGSPVAVKVALQCGKNESASLVSILNELRILRQVRHANLVLLYGACINVERQDLSLVLEQINGVALEPFLMQRREDVKSGRYRYKVLLDVSSALRYLHSRRPLIVHSDLKASNILVEEGASVIRFKLCDFGFSRLTTRSSVLAGGTLSYMAPEILCHSRTPSPPVDVFSFGRLIYFVSTSIPPYERLPRKAFVDSAKLGSFPPLVWPSESWALDDCKSLAGHCLCFDADMRPTMELVYLTLQSWHGYNTASSNSDYSSVPVFQACDHLRTRFSSRVGKKHKLTEVPRGCAPKIDKDGKPSRHSQSISTAAATEYFPRENHLEWLASIVIGVDATSLETPAQTRESLDATSVETPIRTCDFCFTATNSMPSHVSICLPQNLSQWMAQDEITRIGKNVKLGLESPSVGSDLVKNEAIGPAVLFSPLQMSEVRRTIVANAVDIVHKDKESSTSASGRSESMLSLTFRDFRWGEPLQDSYSEKHELLFNDTPYVGELVNL